MTPRNVLYQYSATDPERLLRLKKTPGNKNLVEYTYDDGGAQLTRYYPDSKELWEYVYDGKSQLRRVTKKLNGAVQGSEEYWYDHAGARYLVVKRNNTGAKTGAIWFFGDTEAHYDASGTVTRAFGHVSMGTPVARIDRSTDGPSITEYQFHGLANNTLAAVDQVSGTINASFVYAPFGEIIEATDAGGANNGLAAHQRRMNDKFVDTVSGLAYYGARYYDKLSMSWTQSDPLYLAVPDLALMNSPRRANLYQFSLNNSLRYVDPDGLDPGNQLSSYRSEAEQRDGVRALLEADKHWGVNKGHCSWNSNACSFIINQDNRGAWARAEARREWGRRNLACGGCLVKVHGPAVVFSTEFRGDIFGPVSDAIKINVFTGDVWVREATPAEELAFGIIFGLGSAEALAARFGLSIFGRAAAPSAGAAGSGYSLWPAASGGRVVLNGLEYTVHALERMAPVGLGGRGVPPSAVENAIKFGVATVGRWPDTIVHAYENVTVVTNTAGNIVVTVIRTGG